MILKILNDISAYIEYLNGQGYYVIIHDTQKNFEYMFALSKYKIHDNPFCLLVKSNDEAWSHCIYCQKKIYKKFSEEAQPFWGMCYAGVEEYVFPLISVENEVIGFISISGYGIDSVSAHKRILKVADDYSLNKSQMKYIYDNKLIKTAPSLSDIQVIIQPLCRMLEYLYELIPRNVSTKNNPDFIYTNAIAFINRHYADNLTLAKISQYCNCSPSYLSHRF